VTDLSQGEIQEIADESGLSPEEVRRSLVLRDSNVPATLADTGMIAASVRGKSVAHAEAQLDVAPDQAVQRVREALGKLAGDKGHMQGGGEADIVDETRGVTYRIRAEDDGRGGALVRVDVDPSLSAGQRALYGTLVIGGGAALALLGAFTWAPLLWLGLGGAALGGLALFASRNKTVTGTREAHMLAAQSLTDVESKLAALPAAERDALPPGAE
jgi:hypothetical protein